MTQHEKVARPQDWFVWERPDIDFPLYQDDTIPLWQVVMLFVCPLVVLAVVPLVDMSRAVKSLLFFFGMLAPFLVVARGDILAIVKRPRLGDVPLVLIALVLTIVYSMAAAIFIQVVLGITIQGNIVDSEEQGGLFRLWVLIQLFGEEMFKLDTFLSVLILMYRRTANRKTSVVVAILVTMVVFGLGHIRAYQGSILQVLLIQGVGSTFDQFCYLRTKNVLPPYAMHVLLDFMFLP